MPAEITGRKVRLSGWRGHPLCAAPVMALALLLPHIASAQAERKVNINEYIVRGNTVLDARSIEKAVYPFLGPERSLSDIEKARDALQEVYNAQGYQSVYVDLPEQAVADGVVFFQVTETKVGRVRVVGAEHYSPLAIRDGVPSLQEGQVPDFSKAQAELAELNRGASRQVMPMVKEGRVPGTMDVDLRVDDKTPWSASVGLNNDYSADTSKLRGMVTLGHDNLWQSGHTFSLTYFTAPRDMQDAKVWSAAYTMPLSPRWSLAFTGYKSDSDVSTVGGTNVLGKGQSYGIHATYTFPQSGTWYHTASIGMDYKDFEEQTRFGETSDRVPLTYLPFTLAYNGYRYTEDSQTSVGLTLTGASRSLFGLNSEWEEFDYKRWMASPSFMVFKGDLNHTETFAKDWQAYGRVGFQIGSGALVSNEQFSAGGATSVRGYLAAERSADDGWMASVELRTPSLARWIGPSVNEWRFYAFSDVARLRLRDPLPEQESSFHLASVGIGTRLQMFDWLSLHADWAYPLTQGVNTERHDPRVHFSLRASF